MTHRDKEQARALEYARSQGWGPTAACMRCEALERGQQVAVDALAKASERIADLEVELAAERESHEVAKRAVLRKRRAP